MSAGEYDDEVTQVSEPPTLRVWWTGHMKGPDNRLNEHLYVTRTGYWHGSATELVKWFGQQADSLRAPVDCYRLVPEKITVREWRSSIDMLNAAAAAVCDGVPMLLPLPPGKGVLFVSGHVSEHEWKDIRAEAQVRWSRGL